MAPHEAWPLGGGGEKKPSPPYGRGRSGNEAEGLEPSTSWLTAGRRAPCGEEPICLGGQEFPGIRERRLHPMSLHRPEVALVQEELIELTLRATGMLRDRKSKRLQGRGKQGGTGLPAVQAGGERVRVGRPVSRYRGETGARKGGSCRRSSGVPVGEVESMVRETPSAALALDPDFERDVPHHPPRAGQHPSSPDRAGEGAAEVCGHPGDPVRGVLCCKRSCRGLRQG